MEKTPFAGQLDKVIAVYQAAVTRNGIGEAKETDTLVASPRAMLTERPGSREVDGSVVHEVNRVFTIRRYPVIAEGWHTMHIIYSGTKYRIESVRDIQRSHLEISVTAYE